MLTLTVSGPQLRQDDPSSLKDIVILLQAAISKAGAEKLTVRTKFMIETINSLKNNRMKTGRVRSEISTEHTVRMKKILGGLKASEPLRITVQDIRDSDKRGKWWLVGASFRDEGLPNERLDKQSSGEQREQRESLDANGLDLLRLAKEQRMNITDIHRSIFVTIMSATDYKDAHRRLIKLGLKRSQELTIPVVLLHCAAAEELYNPYYTLISRELCADSKLKWAFQFTLWGIFEKMGEGTDGDSDEEKNDDRAPTMRGIVNLAKMYGVLILEDRLGLHILKVSLFPMVRKAY